MGNIFKTGFTLFLITVVAAVLLGYVYEVTKQPIEKAQNDAKTVAMQKILPSADQFKTELKKEIDPETDGLVTEVLTGYSGAEIAGYILNTNPKGYAGKMGVLVAINTKGIVEGISIVKSNETPGLGANASKPKFTDQFKGKPGPFTVIKSGTPNDNDIQAITSATITSKAVKDGVNSALRFYQNNLAEGGQ